VVSLRKISLRIYFKRQKYGSCHVEYEKSKGIKAKVSKFPKLLNSRYTRDG